jgi:hypothetical protein
VASALAQEPRHLFLRVAAGPEITAPVSGSLLIFLSAGEGAKEVDLNEFHPGAEADGDFEEACGADVEGE